MKKILILFLFYAINLAAQSFSGGFTFTLPPKDTSSSTFLPSFPIKQIGNEYFVTVDNDGHFSINGEAIRFWGSNIVSGAAFPDTSKTWFIAGRLRQMGFNLIRFHHIDNPWGSESLFEYPNKGTRHLNPVTLDRMEKLISSLKNNGIYINMNLNVSRTFQTIDGVAGADSIQEFGKGVTQFDPYLIELQKEYAQQLLTHVNSYTGLALKDDPVMAMVEIANENSVYRFWRDNLLKPFAQGGRLIYRHSLMLDSMWNKYLLDKYANTENLAQRWNQGIENTLSTNIVKNGNFESGNTTNWVFEKANSNVDASMSVDNANPYKGIYSVKLNVTKLSSVLWELQWKQVGLAVKKDSFYTVMFAARSDGNKKITVGVMRDNSPWNYYSGQEFSLTTGWNIYKFSFKAPEDNLQNTRLTFEFHSTGSFWFDEISIGKPIVNGLLEGESIENLNVLRMDFSDCIGFSDNRIKDISDFYIQVQTNYFNTIKDYLKNTLGVKVPIVGTNWNVGAADLSIQSELDYIDNHSYWDHPNFPGIPWSSTDWNISNNPMVKSSSAGTIPDLFAGVAMVGKPYTISEYNHAFPNRYQSEAPLFISAYSSFHYADGIMFFDYNGENSWESDKISSYFSIHRNNILMALMPSCAFAFRNNLIKKANQTLLVNYTDDKIKLFPKDDPGGWQGYYLYPKKLSLVHAIRNQSFQSSSTTDFTAFPAEPVNPYKTDTDEIIYNTNGLFTVNSPSFAGLSGQLSAFPNSSAGSFILKSSNDYGTITWLSLSEDSLINADKSLLTISSKIQNTNMQWDGTNTIHNNWGSAPTQIFPLSVVLELKIAADSIYVYPLDNTGLENHSNYKKYLPTSPGRFTFTINQNTDKTLWFGIEKFGNGSPTEVDDEKQAPVKFGLEQNYPNPFNPTTNLLYRISESEIVTIKVFDILGNEIATLVNEIKSPGEYNITFDAAGLSSGVYYYTLKSGSYSEAKKMVVMK